LGSLEGHAGAWSPDGQRMAYCKGNEILLATSDGGEPRRLLLAAGTSSDLRWSPDGSILRFTLNDPKTNNRSIWQVSAEGGNLVPCFRVGTAHPTNAVASGRRTEGTSSSRLSAMGRQTFGP